MVFPVVCKTFAGGGSPVVGGENVFVLVYTISSGTYFSEKTLKPDTFFKFTFERSGDPSVTHVKKPTRQRVRDLPGTDEPPWSDSEQW